jgi:NADP-dependent 3-hydroxy acid dehydrogenase YdfG
MHTAGVRVDEAAGAPRGPHHQQRLALGAGAASTLCGYTATKHAITGLTRSTSLDGRAFDIACGQIDIGNAGTEMTGPMRTTGVVQADGSTAREPTIDVEHVAHAIVYMATLPLGANVQFMTVMATKMPFVGRG